MNCINSSAFLLVLVSLKGFDLMSLNGHRGHFIDKVEAYSRAEQAGLKHGDLVLEVNGTAILHYSHDGVVDLIKSFARDSKQSRYCYSFQLRNLMPLPNVMWIID